MSEVQFNVFQHFYFAKSHLSTYGVFICSHCCGNSTLWCCAPVPHQDVLWWPSGAILGTELSSTSWTTSPVPMTLVRELGLLWFRSSILILCRESLGATAGGARGLLLLLCSGVHMQCHRWNQGWLYAEESVLTYVLFLRPTGALSLARVHLLV